MRETQTYSGGCHCGRVRFEVTAALDSAMSCNCSICSKRGSLLAFVPAEQFRHTAGSDAELTDYQFNKHVIHHLFCPVCGILSYAKGTAPDGRATVALNVRCLDDVDLSTLRITEWDGRNM